MGEMNRIDKLLDGMAPDAREDLMFWLTSWGLWSSQEVSDKCRAYRWGHLPSSTIRDWRRRNGFCKPLPARRVCTCAG